MNDKLNIVVIAGTKRVRRESIKAAHFVAEMGRQRPELEIIFVDPNDFNLPGDGNDPEGKDPKYTEITARADGFFIVSPEYNHSFPGSLKRLLDSELENYIHKPVALAGASNGNWGGVRCVEALVITVREMGLAATFTSAYFPRVQDLFNQDGSIKPEYSEMYTKNVNRAYDELIWMAKTFKWGRDNLPRA